jgi:hypothetical protein
MILVVNAGSSSLTAHVHGIARGGGRDQPIKRQMEIQFAATA